MSRNIRSINELKIGTQIQDNHFFENFVVTENHGDKIVAVQTRLIDADQIDHYKIINEG